MAEAQHVTRRMKDEPFIVRVDRGIYQFSGHWLLVVNTIAFLLASMPFITPYLASQGFAGMSRWMHAAFGLICHQIPDHSFSLFGEQMVLCHRCTAMYVASFIVGLAYVFVRDRIPPLEFRGLFILAAPMALDGFTQLLGLRESTWELRLITGSLFAFGVMWFALPRLEQGFAEIREVVEQRFRRLVHEGRSNPL